MGRYFRGEKLIDRDEDIKFFLNWFEKIPKEILWVYGPKSSGKTTLIEYVVENELFEDFWKFKLRKDYWVRYVNLRGKLITSYNTFLESFIKPKKSSKKEESLSARVNVGILELKAGLLNGVKNREKDLFDVIMEEINKIKAKNKILIIDEIQTLQEIYINGDKELLKEFLNFCVRLTKETHLCHVMILSSNTIFIDRIYNDAKLKKTSHFYKIDHLEKSIVFEWLSQEGVSEDEIELIWDYLGGCIPDIQKFLREWDKKQSLEEYLERKKWLAYTEIVHFLNFSGKIDKEERKKFYDVCREIVEKGYVEPQDDSYRTVIEKFTQVEILFFDPLDVKIRGNSRIYEKGMEKIVS